MLYMISTDKLAEKFCNERFEPMLKKAEPLAKKRLTGRGSGASTLQKIFVDASLTGCGSQSIFNFQSLPYKFVPIDEYDSMLDAMREHGDPLALAEARTRTFPVALVIPFAHPSSRSRGVGKVYYNDSDQRRLFVKCPHCAGEFWLQWNQVQVIPLDGMTKAQAELDARCYQWFAPCCGAKITDAQRWAIARKAEMRSTLPKEQAAKKKAIGIHFSRYYMPGLTLESFAVEWIAALVSPSLMRVFVNKGDGDVYDVKADETEVTDWERLRPLPDSPDAYEVGDIPEQVQFLTAGADFRAEQIHYSMWGWGWVRASDQIPRFCGWLVRYGVFRRNPEATLAASELHVLDFLHNQGHETKDGRQLFCKALYCDTGWMSMPIYDYCRRAKYAAFPTKGEYREKYPQYIRWTSGITSIKEGKQIPDPRLKLGWINRSVINPDWLGLVKKRFAPAKQPEVEIPFLRLPCNVSQAFMEDSASEYLTTKDGKPFWAHNGQNHWSDTNVGAYVAAKQVASQGNQLPFDEKKEKKVHYGVVGKAFGG
jgi:phage terminase large subunit GpA-like protein